MGFADLFWKGAEKVYGIGSAAIDSAKGALKEHNEKIAQYKKRYQHLSESELRYKWQQSDNITEKMAIGSIMRENGWIEPKDSKQ